MTSSKALPPHAGGDGELAERIVAMFRTRSKHRDKYVCNVTALLASARDADRVVLRECLDYFECHAPDGPDTRRMIRKIRDVAGVWEPVPRDGRPDEAEVKDAEGRSAIDARLGEGS